MKSDFRRILKISLPILLLGILCIPFSLFAVNTTSTKEKVNARMLPIVWYSTLSIKDGESIRIYSGIQNNSGADFSGTVAFYVNDKEIAKKSFLSQNDRVTSAFADWTAEVGKSVIEVKIVDTNLSSNKTLVSYNTEKSTLNIVRKITTEDVEKVATDFLSGIVEGGDGIAGELIGEIEDLKDPLGGNDGSKKNEGSENEENKVQVKENSNSSGTSDGESNDDENGEKKSIGKVLSASVGLSDEDGNMKPSVKNFFNSLFNIALDGISFLVKNWIWTLLGLVGIFLIYKFF